jgi:hypothetical protein
MICNPCRLGPLWAASRVTRHASIRVMKLMQVRYSPEDVRLLLSALSWVAESNRTADETTRAIEMNAHLYYQAVRLWGTDWYNTGGSTTVGLDTIIQ